MDNNEALVYDVYKILMPLLGFKSNASKLVTMRERLNSGTVKARMQELGVVVPQKVTKDKRANYLVDAKLPIEEPEMDMDDMTAKAI